MNNSIKKIKAKTTILVPLYERKEFSLRLLEYYNSKKILNPFFLADGSKKSQFTNSFLKNKFKFIKIKYKKFPHDKNFTLFAKKMVDSIKLIKTNYIIMLTNDDFLNSRFLLQAEKYLDKKKNYSFIGGLVYDFNILQLFKNTNDFGLFKFKGKHYSGLYRDIISNSTTSRIKYFNSALSLECLYRKKTLLNTWNLAYKFKVRNSLEYIWFFLFVPLLEGKKKLLKIPSVLRQSNTFFSEGQLLLNLDISLNRYNEFVEFLIKEKNIKEKKLILLLRDLKIFVNINQTLKKKLYKFIFLIYMRIKLIVLKINSIVFYFIFLFFFKNKKYLNIYKSIDKYF
jgi:glycosyltransferase domain-containing protein